MAGIFRHGRLTVISPRCYKQQLCVDRRAKRWPCLSEL